MDENVSPIEAMQNMYRASLKAMSTELTGLLEFTYEFKGEESSQRLKQAQELIDKEERECNK